VLENKPFARHLISKFLFSGARLTMLNWLSFVLTLMLGPCISCALFIASGWLAATFAKYFRYEPYKPNPGHELAAERVQRWYPL
jgi:hypothetical protein